MEEEKTTPETQKPDSRPDRSQLNAFENFYENFRKVPLKYIDVFLSCIGDIHFDSADTCHLLWKGVIMINNKTKIGGLIP